MGTNLSRTATRWDARRHVAIKHMESQLTALNQRIETAKAQVGLNRKLGKGSPDNDEIKAMSHQAIVVRDVLAATKASLGRGLSAVKALKT